MRLNSLCMRMTVHCASRVLMRRLVQKCNKIMASLSNWTRANKLKFKENESRAREIKHLTLIMVFIFRTNALNSLKSLKFSAYIFLTIYVGISNISVANSAVTGAMTHFPHIFAYKCKTSNILWSLRIVYKLLLPCLGYNI